jgi:hypothetical protein
VVFGFKPSAQPGLEKTAHDAITWIESRNSGANRHNFTCSVGTWDSAYLRVSVVLSS